MCIVFPCHYVLEFSRVGVRSVSVLSGANVGICISWLKSQYFIYIMHFLMDETANLVLQLLFSFLNSF